MADESPPPPPPLGYQPPPRHRWDSAARRRRRQTPFVLLFMAGLALITPTLVVVPVAYADHTGPAAAACCGGPAALGVLCVAVAAVGFHWPTGDGE